MIRSSLLMMVAGGLIFICGVNYGRNHNPTKCWYTGPIQVGQKGNGCTTDGIIWWAADEDGYCRWKDYR